jgi:DNA-binding beta-propeller fold protein YncE
MTAPSTHRALALAAALTVASASHLGAQQLSGGEGLMYVGAYSQEIYVIRESDLTVAAKIPTTAGIPGGLVAGADGSRLYAPTIDYEHVEIFDARNRRSIGSFTLSEGNAKVRVRSMAVHPDGRHALLMVRRYEKLRDRWDIGDMELVLYDMQDERVVQDVPWPDGEPLETVSFDYAPDGRHLYFFRNVVHVYDTESYTEVDRWDYSGALDQGLGAFRFGFGATPREETGWHAGFFRVHEEFQDRDVLGVARANPTERKVEFFMLGPAEDGPSSSFALAPDRTRAYALHQEVGNYQLWSIDMQARTARHVVFPGRPRMSLEVSSNGRLLYVYAAGNTIDVFDAATLEHRRTVELDSDMTIGRLWILPPR